MKDELYDSIYYGLKDGTATYHLVDTSLTSPIRTEGYTKTTCG